MGFGVSSRHPKFTDKMEFSPQKLGQFLETKKVKFTLFFSLKSLSPANGKMLGFVTLQI